APERGKDLQAPAEKKPVQPKDTTPPPAINKKESQAAPPAMDQGRQPRGDEGRIDKKQREIKTPEKQKRQAPPVAPPEKSVVQPKDTTPPPAIDKKGRKQEQPVAVPERQPRKVEEKSGQANKRTGAPATKGPSEKQDSGVKKQEKKKPSLTQEEEEAQDLKVPERKGR
ncbi:MAG: hypothetical protein WAV13_10550, partial [Thermodesulfovibrionales bacterium]